MTVIAVCSTKHSPGATTLSLALVTAWASATSSADAPPVLIEADPAGGDLAARLGLGFDPGLVSLAAAARHAGSEIDVIANSQPLPCGGIAVLGPTNPDQAETSVGTVARRLCSGVRKFGLGVVDCGRWATTSPTSDIMRAADFTLVVVRPDVAGVEHLRERMDDLSSAAGGRLGVVLVGDRPYGPSSVQPAIGLLSVMTMPIDRDGAEAVYGAASARSTRRSRLARSARTILDSIEATKVEGVFA